MSALTSSSLLRFSFLPKVPALFKPAPSKPLTSSFSRISFQKLNNSINNNKNNNSSLQSPSSSSPTMAEVDPTLLPPKLQHIITLFQSVSDPKSKYQQLLHYSTQLPPFPPQFKNDSHRVRGCVSQVWVRADPDPTDSSKIQFQADSDSALTKGLAALLVFGLSGASASEIASVSPEFVHLLGLRQSLTPSRNNGFLNMLTLMQKKAAQIGGLVEGAAQDEIFTEEDQNLETENSPVERNLDFEQFSGGKDEILMEEVVDETEEAGLDGISGGGVGERKARIISRLEKELSPVELVVEDISHQHAGHAGVRGNTSGETHFNVRVVSKEFEGKSLVKRHRLVYDLLSEELESGLHALSIVAKTPSEIRSS